MRGHHKQKGFTIIEVVLVLAIAGLIFLIVFLAVPQLQRNQRDTQRKQDMARLSAAIIGYPKASGRPTVAEFISQVLPHMDNSVDPATGEPYTWVNWATLTDSANQDRTQDIYYWWTSGGVKCVNNVRATPGDSALQFVIAYHLEGGGWVCNHY